MTGDSNLAQGTWEEAQALVGQPLASWQGADEVTAADIRRKLEVIGFDCPLHYDEACARAHGYESIVAPVSMVRVWAMPAYWSPGQPRIGAETRMTPVAAANVPGEGDTLIATKMRVEHLSPVYPGDRISALAVLKSVTPKTTRVGPGAFLIVETTYSNQRNDPVAVETVTFLRYTQQQGDA